MRDAKQHYTSGALGALEWNALKFREVSAMGETKSRRLEENLEARIHNISRILFSEDSDSRIKKLIYYHLRFERVFEYQVKICEFIRWLKKENIKGFYKSQVGNLRAKNFLAVHSEYEFIGYDNHPSTDVLIDRIFDIYYKLRDHSNPHDGYRAILNLCPPIFKPVNFETIYNGLKDHSREYWDSQQAYENERNKFFKNRAKIEAAKQKYDAISENISSEAKDFLPFARECLILDKEKNELLRYCYEVDDLKRELEVIYAVHSGKGLEVYLVKLGLEYQSIINLINRI